MDLNRQPSFAPARASATVVMLRDGEGGLEVFLQKRHGLSDVLGGAYVFPGGKVDAEDAETAMHARLDAPPALLRETLGEPDLDEVDAAALYVAAVREAFEEAGVLFASGVAGDAARDAWAMLRTGRSFHEVLEELSLPVMATALRPWSRWVTPIVGGVIRKRFDTRFFLARVPAGQVAVHDNREATESVWLAPREALRQYWDRDIELAPPQIMSLAHLARHRNVDSVMADAAARRPPLIQPEPFELEGKQFVCYPGDANHPVRERALPGPTRLHYMVRRFEPPGGFDALFDDS